MTVETEIIPMSLEHKVHRINHQHQHHHHHHYHLHQILESHHLYIHNQTIQEYILNHQENLERQRELQRANRLIARQHQQQLQEHQQDRLSITSTQSLPTWPASATIQQDQQQYQSLVNLGTDQQNKHHRRQQQQHQHVIAPQHQQQLSTSTSAVQTTTTSASSSLASLASSSCHSSTRHSYSHLGPSQSPCISGTNGGSGCSSIIKPNNSKQRSQIHFLLLSAFAYILSPIDLIPEVIFGVFGILDDLLFLFLCLFCVAIILLYPLFREIRRTILGKLGLQNPQQHKEPPTPEACQQIESSTGT